MIKLSDISEDQFEAARQVVHEIVALQSKKITDWDAAYRTLYEVMGIGIKKDKRSSLISSLYDSLSSSLNNSLSSSLYSSLHSSLFSSLHSSLFSSLFSSLHSSLYSSLHSSLYSSLHSSLFSSLDSSLYDSLISSLDSTLSIEYVGTFWGYWLAYYQIGQIFGVRFDAEKYQLFNDYTVNGCSLLAKFTIKGKNKIELPLILLRPHKCKFQVSGKTAAPFEFPVYELHAEGESCVEHICLKEPLYFWHNVSIPKRMGEVRVKDWRAKWILDETNAEIKRILLKEIGPEKVAQELEAKVIDKWQGYELLELPIEESLQYRYCKMKCPSTGDAYMLRVPPDTESAHEAITWINHGVKPEEIFMES